MVNKTMLPDPIKAWINGATSKELREVEQEISRLATDMEVANISARMQEDDERCKALLYKAISLGFKEDKLEPIYIPANTTFDELIAKLRTIRIEHGCKDYYGMFFESFSYEKPKIFDNYGVKNKPQWLVLVHSDEVDGLWFTKKTVKKQINESKKLMAKKPGLRYLSPAAYVCAQIRRAASVEGDSDNSEMLDFNNGFETVTLFPQYIDGVRSKPSDQKVPSTNLRSIRFRHLSYSQGDARWDQGVRLAVEE
ncbi:hypothetical protein AGMMS49975_15870 [Clostridia bacterium]|nr:hypothetical protein AGMMS49975_15870 [Clostridia bacterium]